MVGMQQIPGSLAKRFVGIQVSSTACVRGKCHVPKQRDILGGTKFQSVSEFNGLSFGHSKWKRQLGRCGSTRGDKQQVKLEDIFDESTIETFIPLLGFIALFAIGAPLVGMALPSIGIAGLVVAMAFFSGQVTKISTTYGISPLNSAVAIAGVVFSILAIPALLKLGIFLLAGLFALNFASNLVGANNFSQSEDIDASNAIIDVDYESVDD
jgi:hypothetical protein